MYKLESRNQVIDVLLASMPEDAVLKMVKEGCRGLDNLSNQELVGMARTTLSRASQIEIDSLLDELQNSADNRAALPGDYLYRVLVTREAGTESAYVYIHAKTAKEAKVAGLTMVNLNKVGMQPDEVDSENLAYLCDADCLELITLLPILPDLVSAE